MAEFVKATKRQSRLRMGLIGPAGSGKTYTALNIAQHLGAPVAVIDTERGSASKYSDIFDFSVLELESFEPDKYIDGIRSAASAGFEVLVIDSLSHAWSGKGGILEYVDNVAKRQGGNSFGAWREATPRHNALVDAILQAPMHIIVTMRAKTEFVQEKDERTGKTHVRKVGLQPVQRDGLEYEMDVVADIDIEHNFIVSKTRCPALTDKVFSKAGEDAASILKNWLTDGAAPAPAPSAPTPPMVSNGASAAADPWADAADWMLAARLYAKEKGVKFGQLPDITRYGTDHPVTVNLARFAAELEPDVDPLAVLKQMIDEQVPA